MLSLSCHIYVSLLLGPGGVARLDVPSVIPATTSIPQELTFITQGFSLAAYEALAAATTSNLLFTFASNPMSCNLQTVNDGALWNTPSAMASTSQLTDITGQENLYQLSQNQHYSFNDFHVVGLGYM